MTLLERMKEVLANNRWTGREWARRAELGEENHVNLLMRALRNGRERPGDMETWAKLASSAGVSLDWLVLGRGTPHAMQVEIIEDGRYPSRPRVLAVAHWIGFPDAAIRAVSRHIPDGDDDPGPDYWLRLLQTEQARYPALPSKSSK